MASVSCRARRRARRLSPQRTRGARPLQRHHATSIHRREPGTVDDTMDVDARGDATQRQIEPLCPPRQCCVVSADRSRHCIPKIDLRKPSVSRRAGDRADGVSARFRWRPLSTATARPACRPMSGSPAGTAGRLNGVFECRRRKSCVQPIRQVDLIPCPGDTAASGATGAAAGTIRGSRSERGVSRDSLFAQPISDCPARQN